MADQPTNYRKEIEMDRNALLASLGAVADTDNLYFDDDRYLDWSFRNADGVTFEIGDDAKSTSIDLTRAEMVELHKRLTLWLLANED